MSGRDGYGFCPRCGALMQDGICRSCGYSEGNPWHRGAEGQQTGTGWTEPYGGAQGQNPQAPVIKPVKNKKGNGRTVGIICAVIGILCVAAIVLFMIFSIRKVVREVEKGMPDYHSEDGYFGYGNPYQDDWYDNYGGDSSDGEYVPDEKDDYYEEITDATSGDLDYQVIWGTLSLRPEDEDDGCTYECVYPVLTGEGEEEKYAAMNRVIEDLVCKYKGRYREYASGASSYGYVTYMDEEKISVAVRHSFYEKKTTVPRVEAVTLRVDNGEVISHEEMAEVDEELVWQFRSRNTYQNGKVEFVDGLSDEELMEYLKSGEDSVMFYTPVGLEIGFNYDGGWVTVTLKTNTV